MASAMNEATLMASGEFFFGLSDDLHRAVEMKDRRKRAFSRRKSGMGSGELIIGDGHFFYFRNWMDRISDRNIRPLQSARFIGDSILACVAMGT
jgi:hypothetical protein